MRTLCSGLHWFVASGEGQCKTGFQSQSLQPLGRVLIYLARYSVVTDVFDRV